MAWYGISACQDRHIRSHSQWISCRSSPHCYLPRRHHRPATDVCWSRQAYQQILFPLSEATTFDQYWRLTLQLPLLMLWSLVAQTTATLFLLEYMASTWQRQAAVNAAAHPIAISRSSTASHPWFMMSCIGCWFNSISSMNCSTVLSQHHTRQPVDHMPTSLREYPPSLSTFDCMWRSGSAFTVHALLRLDHLHGTLFLALLRDHQSHHPSIGS